MPRYTIRDADTYGHAIGILLLDYRGPFIPGDVGNATSYGYPVLYKVVKGLTFEAVKSGDQAILPDIIEAAKELERFGVRGISSDCGFLIKYQKAVAEAVRVPVFMSSLLQIPFLAMTLDPSRPVGCLTAARRALGNQVLEMAGVRSEINVVVHGMDDYEHFKWSILEEGGELDSDLIEGEIVTEAKAMHAAYPDLAAIVLECSLMPPYSAAVQKATGLPVFDFLTMIDYFYAGTHQTPYQGYY